MRKFVLFVMILVSIVAFGMFSFGLMEAYQASKKGLLSAPLTHISTSGSSMALCIVLVIASLISLILFARLITERGYWHYKVYELNNGIPVLSSKHRQDFLGYPTRKRAKEVALRSMEDNQLNPLTHLILVDQ